MALIDWEVLCTRYNRIPSYHLSDYMEVTFAYTRNISIILTRGRLFPRFINRRTLTVGLGIRARVPEHLYAYMRDYLYYSHERS